MVSDFKQASKFFMPLTLSTSLRSGSGLHIDPFVTFRKESAVVFCFTGAVFF